MLLTQPGPDVTLSVSYGLGTLDRRATTCKVNIINRYTIPPVCACVVCLRHIGRLLGLTPFSFTSLTSPARRFCHMHVKGGFGGGFDFCRRLGLCLDRG